MSPSGSNVTLSLGVAAGGAVLVWLGIKQPEGGLPGAIQRVLNGQPAAGAAKAAGNVLDFAPALYGGGSSSSSGGTSSGSSGGQASIVTEAEKWLGVPYEYGGNTRAGIDCSGLVQQVFKTFGVSMPRVAAAQALMGEPVAIGSQQPGDLMAYGRPVYHIGFWSGSDVLHAPHTGTVVKHEALSSVMPNASLLTIRRVTLGGAASPLAPIRSFPV